MKYQVFRDGKLVQEGEHDGSAFLTITLDSAPLPAGVMARKEIMNKDRFTQGYVCCICTLIRADGIDSIIVDAFLSGVGKSTLKDLKEAGVEQYDLDLLKQHWEELNYRP